MWGFLRDIGYTDSEEVLDWVWWKVWIQGASMFTDVSSKDVLRAARIAWVSMWQVVWRDTAPVGFARSAPGTSRQERLKLSFGFVCNSASFLGLEYPLLWCREHRTASWFHPSQIT